MTPTPAIRWATLLVALTAILLVVALTACGGSSGPDYNEPVRTGETTPEGEHCVADLPDGSCMTEEEGERGEDRWAAYIDCVQERDGDPNDTCPTPGEMP